MNITIPVYSEQELTPRAAEVLRAIVDDAYPEHTIKFKPFDEFFDLEVLVFGKVSEFFPTNELKIVYTYSIAQMMSKANAASVIKSALRQFIEAPDPIPFGHVMHSVWSTWIESTFDFAAPTAIDIETSGNLGKTHTAEEVGIISVAFYQAGKSPFVVHGDWDNINNTTRDIQGAQLEELKRVIVKFTKGIYHNGKFDVRVLNRVLGVKLNVWFDTMLAHHVLNIAAGDHKLKTAARRYLGAPEWEEDLKKYLKNGGHYERIPILKLVDYNGYDVYWTYKLWEFFAPQIEADDNAQRALMVESAAADFLLDVENYGIPLDLEYAEAYGKDLDAEMAKELEYMRSIVNDDKYNPNSPVQVKARLLFWDIQVKTTREPELQAVLDERDDDGPWRMFLESHLRYKKLSKINGTYVKGWASRSRNERVHPTYLVHGTSTGRLSSTNPNAQNMPRDKQIRKVVRTLGNE